MAQCSICSSKEARAINVLLLTGAQIPAVAKQFGFGYQVVSSHQRKHLPWRSRKTPKPRTVEEKLEQLEYEFARLRVLAESGEKIGEALRVLVAQRNLLELLLRKEGGLDAHHKKLILNSQQPTGDYEVTFENGKMRTVETK
jgi:hypothetical protein